MEEVESSQMNNILLDFFNEDYTLEHFCNTVESFDVSVSESNSPRSMYDLKSSRSPRRKTLGAVVAELKAEIQNIRLELEIRDAYIIALIENITKSMH